MFTDLEEEIFFLSHLNEETNVLEFGSGDSTLEISKKCKKIISIEHQKHWYEYLIDKIPSNCDLVLKEPNLPYVEGRTDGTIEEFYDYVNFPLSLGPFDVILIDGRARVSCCSICEKISHPNTIIFVHDFERQEYQPCLEFLELIEQKGRMAKFKLKK